MYIHFLRAYEGRYNLEELPQGKANKQGEKEGNGNEKERDGKGKTILLML